MLFTKNLLVLATVGLSMFAGVLADPVAEPSSDVSSITQRGLHVRDFAILGTRDAKKCDDKYKSCMKSADKQCKGKKGKCAAYDACKADHEKCMKKYVKPAKEEQAGDKCGICLETWALGEGDLYMTKCGHYFDRACIMQWYKGSGSKACPMCRQ